MKKPDFIKISFPAELKDCKTAVQKYFNFLLHKSVKIGFAVQRSGKIQEYFVSASKIQKWYSCRDGEKPTCEVNIILTKK